MSICINKTAPEWVTLVKAVGEFEAARDYLETGGKIRTPEEVEEKLEQRKFVKEPSQTELAFETIPELANTIFNEKSVKFDIKNNLLDFNLPNETVVDMYNNYMKLMGRKREGKEMTFADFKMLTENYAVFKFNDTYVIGEWDIQNNIFKARAISAPNIKQLFDGIQVLLDNVNFTASVPEDLGKMLDRMGLYKLNVAKFYNFKGEDMDKYLYFSNEALVEKIFKTTADKVTKEQIEKYDTFFNYKSITYRLSKNFKEYLDAPLEKKDILKNAIYNDLRQLGIYDYNALRYIKRLPILEKLVKKSRSENLSNDERDSLIKKISKELEDVTTAIQKNSLLNKVAINKRDLINNPKIYEQLDTELNKILAGYLSKFGIKTEFLADVQTELGIDSLAHVDILRKIINTNENNQKDYPQQAGYMIAYMMQHNPLIAEIKSSMKKHSMFKNLADHEYLKAIGDLIANELHKKTNTKLPETLIEKLTALINSFFLMINELKMNRINRNIGYIADNILMQNESLITASTNKPGKELSKTKRISFEEALKSDKFGEDVVEKMSDYFFLTGSITLAYQGTVYRPDENQMHDIDWVSSFTREDSIKIFEGLYPNNIYVRHIYDNDTRSHTDTWLIAPEGYTISNIKFQGSANKVIAYDILDSDGNVVSSYIPKTDSHTGKIEAKAIDIFSYDNIYEDTIKLVDYTLPSGKTIKINHWHSTFAAKLRFGRLKDIWDYNRYIPKDNLFTASETLFGQAALDNELKNKTTNSGELNKSDSAVFSTSSNRSAIRMANNFARRTGIDYQIITSEEALELTKGALNPWRGEKAFFFGDKVYFVGSNMSMSDVFHEYSHPLVRYIGKTNPKLFNQLYDQVLRSEFGAELYGQVLNQYGLDPNTDFFKEEVIVKALQKSAELKTNNFQEPSLFKKALTNILYKIKQILRELFGSKIPISDLDTVTSLDSLADMLMKGDKFEIDKAIVTNDDIVAYSKERDDYINDLVNIDNLGIQELLNNFHNTANTTLNKLENNQEYERLAVLLMDQNELSDLEAIKSDLQSYKKAIINKATLVKEDMEYVKKKSAALVNAIFRLEKVINKVNLHVKDLASTGQTVENLRKVYYYTKFLNAQQAFVNDAINQMKKFDMPANAPLVTLLSNMNYTIEGTKNKINKIKEEGSVDMLWSVLSPMHKDIEDKQLAAIEALEKKGAPLRKIDKLYKDYYNLTKAELEEYRVLASMNEKGIVPIEQIGRFKLLNDKFLEGNSLSKEKLEKIIKNQAGDANWFNTYLEGYLYNTDPIVGGLATFIKDNLMTVEANVQYRTNTFFDKILPKMKAAGINFNDPGELGEKIGFLDKIAVRNPETGELEMKEIWSLLHEFKDYRYDEKMYAEAIQKARTKVELGGTKEDEEALAKLQLDYAKWKLKYMQQDYVSSYYDRYALLEGPVGEKAFAKRKEILEDIHILTTKANDESDLLNLTDEINAQWKKYRALHSMYYEDGTMKKDVPDQGIYDLSIAKVLKQYQEESAKFHEWVPKSGVFENTLKEYEEEIKTILNEQDWPTEEMKQDAFNAMRQTWIDTHTRTAIKDVYFTRQKNIINSIKEIYAKLKNRKDVDPALFEDASELYMKLFDLTTGYRDQDGQINASTMPQDIIDKVTALQEQIKDVNSNSLNKNGLTPSENQAYRNLWDKKINRPKEWTPQDQVDLNKLINTKNHFGLSKIDIARLDYLKAQLAELNVKEATDYYVDILENRLGSANLNEEQKKKYFKLDKLSAEVFLQDTELIERLRNEDDAFREWFDNNHISSTYRDKDLNADVTKYERSYVWTITKPADEAYYEKYELKDEFGNVVETLNGIPTIRFYKRTVKPEFINERIIGKSTDNKGRWLPKRKDQAGKDWDSKYINDAYFDLINRDPKLKDLLKDFTEFHLDNQIGLNESGKLYMDFPRYRKSNLEVLRTTSLKGAIDEKTNALTIYAQRFKEYINGAADDAESGLNYYAKNNITSLDTFDDDISKVPLFGLFDIPTQDVTTEVSLSFVRYMHQAETQKKLIEISPQVRAVQDVVKNNDDSSLKTIGEKTALDNILHIVTNKKNQSTRLKGLNNLIEREMEGQTSAGALKDNAFLNNLSSTLFKRASFGFFALNINSALKNGGSAKFQALIEASAGKYMNHASLQKGNLFAIKAMGELSFGGQLYKKGSKSVTQQIIEIFDPAQGRFVDKLGESASRTLLKDIASLSWLYNFRKWIELQATLQMFGGMMYHTKIKRFEGTADEVEINYLDAWEVVNGKIQLKEGIDPKWGITFDNNGNLQLGQEFKRFKRKMHVMMNDLQGAYAKFDQPEAQRYLMFRFLSYLRRYFTTMVLNRFGFSGPIYAPQPRVNPGASDMRLGFYIEFLRFMKGLLQSFGKDAMYMTPEEKSATYKVITELMLLYVTTMAMSLLFGWDDEDEDRMKKLKERSGAFPYFPFVAEDKKRPFNAWGWTENHMLFFLMNVKAENEQFLPLPRYGLDDYTALLDLKSIAFGPTIETYQQLIDDGLNILEGDDKAYYKRKVGPYEWQQKGGNKFWAHLARTAGLTGSQLDGAKAIEGFQSAQARARAGQ